MHCNYPDGAGAVLVIELDGAAVEVEQEYAEVERLCHENGAFEQRLATDPTDRALIWKGRKSAFAAVGRISPDYIVQDGVIPRTALPGGAQGDRRPVRLARASGSPTSSTPATATCTRWCSSTTPSRAPARPPRRSAARSSTSASSTAARSPASTASAWTRRSTCRGCTPTTTSTRCSWCAAPSTRQHLQPRQGVPDPAAVRRGARPQEGRPPAAGSRPGGGVLMATATLDRTAREAVGSACADVRDPESADHVDGVVPGPGRPARRHRPGRRGAPGRRRARAHRRPARSRHQAVVGHAADQRRRAARRQRARPGRSTTPAGDLIVDTQAGAPARRRCRRSSARRGQRLALDETVPGASIGGTLATNASGPRRVAVGHRPRPADRHHRGARRRRGRQGRRPRGQERRRLRPRQAADRLVRHPRRDHRGGLPAAPGCPSAQPLGDASRSTTRRRRRTSCSR